MFKPSLIAGAIVTLAVGGIVIALALTIVGGNTGSSYDHDIRAYAACVALPVRQLTRGDAEALLRWELTTGRITIEEIRAALDTVCKKE